MKINVERFVSLELLIGDFQSVEEKVRRYGEVIICNNDMPSYKLSLIENDKSAKKKMTLVKAMEKVLSTTADGRLHVRDITERINADGLYFMENGEPVDVVQVRARASGEPEKFICEKGNYVKLK